MEKENTLALNNSVCTKKKKKEERTSAVRQLFHYSECKIIRYYTNHSDGLPSKKIVLITQLIPWFQQPTQQGCPPPTPNVKESLQCVKE